VIIAKG